MAVQNEPPSEATDSYLRTARSPSSGVLPSRQRFSLSYIRGRCPRLLMVVPSRHRSACGVLVIWISILTGHDATYRTLLSILIGQMLYIALRCLEGSTPEDGGGASHQSKVIVVAPGEPIFYCQRQLFCFVAFRLPTGRPDGWGGSGRQACLHG